jgi:hypothetical protein
MTRKVSIALVLVLALSVLGAGAVAAQPVILEDLPPGVTKQAEPLLMEMMQRMQMMGMTEQQMQMMMADMQMMVDQLPPGVFLQLLQIMTDMDMQEMLQLHELLHGPDNLLQEPPGVILSAAMKLARG